MVLEVATYILKKLPERVESGHSSGNTKYLQDIISEINSMAKEEGMCSFAGIAGHLRH